MALLQALEHQLALLGLCWYMARCCSEAGLLNTALGPIVLYLTRYKHTQWQCKCLHETRLAHCH